MSEDVTMKVLAIKHDTLSDSHPNFTGLVKAFYVSFFFEFVISVQPGLKLSG